METVAAESAMSVGSEHCISRSALGRVAHIGELYDATTDQFVKISVLQDNLPPQCIVTRDNPESRIYHLKSDSAAEKLEGFDVSPELGVSILSGLVDCSGSGRYLTKKESACKGQKSVTIYSQKTVIEELLLSHSSVGSYLFLEGLQTAKASHIVTGIEWGANICVVVKQSNATSSAQREIQVDGDLGLQAAKLGIQFGTVKGGMELSSDKKQSDFQDSLSIQPAHSLFEAGTHYRNGLVQWVPQKRTSCITLRTDAQSFLQFYGDIQPPTLPQSKEEVEELIGLIPGLIRQVNGGKGRALVYHMVPLTALLHMFNIPITAGHISKSLGTHVLNRIIQLYDQLSEPTQNMHNFIQQLKANDECLSYSVMQQAMQQQWEAEKSLTRFNNSLAQALIKTRSGLSTETEMEAALENGMSVMEQLCRFKEDFWHHTHKISLLRNLQMNGAEYIGRDASVDIILMNNADADIYVLFYNDASATENPKQWLKTYHLLLDMITESRKAPSCKRKIFVFLDCDLTQKTGATDAQQLRISHYFGMRLIRPDIMTPTVDESGKSMAKCEDYFEATQHRPNSQALLQLPCPASSRSHRCRLQERLWHCYSCQDTLLYGLDGFCYCSCGKALASAFSFKCCDAAHGDTYVRYDETVFKLALQDLTPFKEMNILIVGETGAGKSTWINGFVNTLTHTSFQDAVDEPEFLIPVSFLYTDHDFIEHKISTGKSDNERLEDGQSSTLEPKAYVFFKGDTRIRLIDTPGVGDTRGIDQDKQNFENILVYLQTIEKLHGICILLKPNESRLTVVLQYCIKELLTRLHRDAAKNIVFVFTNARGTNYRPGDTLATLRRLLKSVKNVNIELSQSNVFCMDNEVVRYLACIKHGIQLPESERQTCQISWNIVADETARLFGHISELAPHHLRNTVSVLASRRLILAAISPLAMAMETFYRNIELVLAKRTELEELKDSQDALQKNLLIEIWEPEITQLPRKRTVCTAQSCITVHNGEIEYTKICHDDCRQGSELEKFPNERLKNCKALKNTKGKICSTCGCGWEKHKHITYEQHFTKKHVQDEAVASQLDQKNNVLRSTFDQIKDIEQFQLQLEEEVTAMYEIASRFGKFLKDNAIIPHNDCIESYIRLKMKELDDVIQHRKLLEIDWEALQDKKHNFERMLESYCTQRKILENVELLNPEEDVNPESVMKDIKRLYNLPHYGKKIRVSIERIDQQQAAMTRYQEIHYQPPSNCGRGNKKLSDKLNKVQKFFTNNVSVSCLGFNQTDVPKETRNSSMYSKY